MTEVKVGTFMRNILYRVILLKLLVGKGNPYIQEESLG